MSSSCSRLVLTLACATLVTACRRGEERELDVRLTTGPFTTIAEAPADGRAHDLVRFVFASVLSPDRSTVPYARFTNYLTARLGRRVVIVRRRTYRELNDLLSRGHADVGIICAGAYAIGREEFGLRLIAGTAVNGVATYRSYIIARRGGKRRLEDFQGAVFAFSDPLSNSGYRYVAATLQERGTSVSRFFGRTFFTYSHDNTIQAVRDGIADGGAVDSLVWDYLVREDPRLADEVEIVARSAEFPANPVVVSPHAAPDVVVRLARVLFEMPTDAAGGEILQDVGISGFVTLQDAAFDPIADSWRELGVITTLRKDAGR